jgi:Domain of unknown function (DUF4185)
MRPRISVAIPSVRKVCQLTGEADRQFGYPAFNTTESRFGLFGTDLGSSFEHGGRLWFLFGDTWPVSHPTDNTDSVASTADTQPEPGIHFEFVNDGSRYRSPRLIGADGMPLSVGAFEVPIAGFSSGGQMYIFYSTDHFDETGGDNGLSAFWVGPDGGIGFAWANPAVDNGIWRTAIPISPPNAAQGNSPIAAITRFAGALDVFWIGPDGAIGTTWSNPGIDNGNWHTPFPITAPGAAHANSPMAAITRLAGALDVFWIGPDGAVATTWANPAIDSGNWHHPFPLTPPGAARADSPIAAITRLEGALDVFWIGPDGAVATNWANPAVDSGNWHTPFPINGPGAARTGSPIAAVTRLAGALDVFWIGPEGAVGTTWANPAVDNGRWHPPFPITPPGATRVNSPISAITRLEGALDVFWIGPDGAVGTTWANPAVDNALWHQPFPITPPGATRANSPIAAITRFAGALDVFWIGPDGAVGTTWANPAVDNARWHPPFPINAPGATGLGAHLAAVTGRTGYPGGKTLMGRTVLAAARNNDPTDLHALYDFSVLRQGGKFINVACVIEPNGVPGLPFTGPALLAWGSGRYRESNVYLACATLGAIQQQSSWHFFTGQGSQWSSDQRLSAPMFIQPQVGELSVAWVAPLGLWLLLYNAGAPRGINARVATAPWGPWSDPVLIFDPGWPGVGYGYFMHVANGSDPMSDPGRQGEWGGEYGPYLIDRYIRTVPSHGQPQAQVYFVMSTWNPYNTVLMTATIQREADGS